MSQGTIQRAKALSTIVEQVLEEGSTCLETLHDVMSTVTKPANEAAHEVNLAMTALQKKVERYEFEIGKVTRLVSSTKGNPGLMMALTAQPHDEALKKALNKVKGWETFRRNGTTPGKVLLKLKTAWPRYEEYIGDSKTRFLGGDKPSFWFEQEWNAKPLLSGEALGADSMRILGLPDENTLRAAEKPGAAAPAKKPTPKPSTPSRSSAKKPASKPAKLRAPTKREAELKADADRAYGEWLGEVNKHGLNLRPDSAPDYWRAAFESGIKPERAVETHRAQPQVAGKTPAATSQLMGLTPKEESAEARRIGKALLKKSNGHAAPHDPASIGATGAFAMR